MKLHHLILAGLLAFSSAFGGNKTPVHGYPLGWVPDAPGQIKAQFSARPEFDAINIAPKSDLSAGMPGVYDQGALGSCTGNGNLSVFEYAWKKQTGAFMQGSRLGLYYDERAIDGTIRQDAGSQISTGIKVLTGTGVGLESAWPYNIAKFTTKPPAAYYTGAQGYQLLKAYNLDNTDHSSIRVALSQGYPVVFGCYVYNAIEHLTPAHYVLPMPLKGEGPIGGHCMVIVGHDDVLKVYLVRNSWGTGYAHGGYLLIPYAYLESGKIADDFWVIMSVKAPPAKIISFPKAAAVKAARKKAA